MDVLDLMVMMVVEMNFIDDSEMMVVSQMPSFDVHPIDPFMGSNSVNPSFLDMWVLKFRS